MQDDDVIVEDILDDYNDFRGRTFRMSKVRDDQPWMTKPLTMTRDRRAFLVEVVGWCRAQRIDARAWVVFLFEVRQWLAAPKLTPGCLQSQPMLEKFRKRGLSQVGRQLLRERLHASAAKRFQNRARQEQHAIPDAAAETLRRRILPVFGPVACRDTPRIGGFDARSPTCSQCPGSRDCRITTMGRMSALSEIRHRFTGVSSS